VVVQFGNHLPQSHRGHRGHRGGTTPIKFWDHSDLASAKLDNQKRLSVLTSG
jgi:hypothetical protein